MSLDKDFETLKQALRTGYINQEEHAALNRIEAIVDKLNGDVPCSTCGTDVNPVWWVDSSLWNAVVRSDLSRWGGREPTLCPACFMRLVELELEQAKFAVAMVVYRGGGVNRPREVLIQAALEDVRLYVAELRSRGWPVEVIAVSEDDWFGLRIEIRLDGIPVPVETEPLHGIHPGDEADLGWRS